MSKVFFGSARMREIKWQSTLPGKLDAILEKLDFAHQLKDKRVCIKMHLGDNVGYTTVHPVFVRRVVSFIKAAGGHPFATDSLGSVLTAHERGYTQETIGCPLVPIAGNGDKYHYTHSVNYKNVKDVLIAGEVWNADYLVCLSHSKGHGNSGYGGAIKNLAIGAMIQKTRNALHMVQHAEKYWDAEKCTHYADGCTKCVDACKVKAMRFADDQTLHVGFHECNFCYECNELCPKGALSIRQSIAEDFQEVMALTTDLVLGSFPKDNHVFINIATNITPFCDCWGFSTPNIVPDIGIFASKDMVAVEKATLDSIDQQDMIPNSLPDFLVMRDIEGHLFKKIHGIDPYYQVYSCERKGLGSSEYEIEEVG